MPEQDQDEIRRFGPKDQKTHLTSEPLFPEDDSPLPSTDELVADTSAIIGDKLAEPLPEPERFPPVRPTLADEPKSPRRKTQKKIVVKRRKRGNWRHNLVALFFFVASLVLAGYFALVWRDPWATISTDPWIPLNPLAPPTQFIVVSETPDPFSGLNATATAASQITPTPVISLNSFSGLPFSLVEAGVVYMPNSNNSGCEWASIAGTVTGLNGEALTGYRISITDAANEGGLSVEVFTGAAQNFGASGFEYVLGSVPRSGRYDIQLFNAVGAPLSDVYRIVTRDTCNQNVAVVNFVQIDPM